MLRSCNDCSKYKIPIVEYDESIFSPKIKFHTYTFFTIYSKYGTILSGNFICQVCSNSVSIIKQKTCETIKKKDTNVETVTNWKVYEGILHARVGIVFVSCLLCIYIYICLKYLS